MLSCSNGAICHLEGMGKRVYRGVHKILSLPASLGPLLSAAIWAGSTNLVILSVKKVKLNIKTLKKIFGSHLYETKYMNK